MTAFTRVAASLLAAASCSLTAVAGATAGPDEKTILLRNYSRMNIGPVRSIAPLASRDELIVNSKGELERLRLDAGENRFKSLWKRWPFPDHMNVGHALAAHPGGKWVLTSGVDNVRAAGKVYLRFIETRHGGERQPGSDMTGHSQAPWTLVCSPDGKLAASAGGDLSVFLWDVDSRSLTAVLKGHTGTVRQLAFSPDSKLLASSSADKTVRVWDVRTGQQLLAAQPDLAPGQTYPFIGFLPRGETLLTSGIAWTQWNPRTGAMLRTEYGLGAGSRFVLSPDGRVIASGGFFEDPDSREKKASLLLIDAETFSPFWAGWKKKDAAPAAVFTGKGTVVDLAFSRDGKRLFWADEADLWFVDIDGIESRK